MKTIPLLFTIVIALTLAEAVQFGLFNRPSHPTTDTTTGRPKYGRLNLGFGSSQQEAEKKQLPLLNILKPVTGILDAVGETVGALLNLLIGGLRYKPYKRIPRPPRPTVTIEIPDPHIHVPSVAIPIGTPATAQVVIGFPTTEPTTEIPYIIPRVDAETPNSVETDSEAPITASSSQSVVSATIPTEPDTVNVTPKVTEETSPTHEPSPTTVASITEKGKPENVDWRRLNCSSPVRFQGKCRGSFAFAVTAAIETHMCFKTGKYAILSPQNLIDCTIVAPFENSGCDGGALEPTYDYVVNIGINSEEDYPYTASGSKCRFDQDKSVGRIKDYMSIDEGDEETMEYVLNHVGPISVGIDATHKSFATYKEGVYFEPKCKSDIENLNHAVLLIGYGVEPDGTRYWLIRNSYGTDWGDQGYGKMARDPPNHCGISTYAVYPVVA